MASLTINIKGQIPRKYALPESWTFRELQTIKRICGQRPAHVWDALSDGDPDTIVALAVVVAQRAGHNITEADLYDLDADSIILEGDEESDEAPTEAGADTQATTPATILEPGGTPPSYASTDSDPTTSPI